MSHLHHRVSGLVDGELTGRARDRALTHVQRCSPCRQELQATLTLKRRLMGLAPTDPSPDLFSTLDNVCHRAAPVCPTRSRVVPLARRLLIGAGSVSLTVLSLAYGAGSPAAPDGPAVTPPVGEFTAEFAGSTGLQALSDPAVGAFAPPTQPVGYRIGEAASGSGESGRAVLLASPIVSPGDDPGAVKVMRRAVLAPSQVAYDGTRQVDSLGPSGTSRVTVDVRHSPRQGTSFDLVDKTTDTSGDASVESTFVAQRAAAEAGELTIERLDLLAAAYDIDLMGSARVLGRATTVVGVSRGGDLNARFWIDDATGLVLRREQYDGGLVARSSRFTALHVMDNAFLSHLPPELVAPPATKLSTQVALALNDRGWTCPLDLPGDFSLTGLNRLEVGGDVMHAAYSDGLSSVSIFEARGRLDDSGLARFQTQPIQGSDVHLRFGLPTVAVWESSEVVYTVVTDAPDNLAVRIVAGLPHELPASSGLASRLGRGLQRLGRVASPWN